MSGFNGNGNRNRKASRASSPTGVTNIVTSPSPSPIPSRGFASPVSMTSAPRHKSKFTIKLEDNNHNAITNNNMFKIPNNNVGEEIEELFLTKETLPRLLQEGILQPSPADLLHAFQETIREPTSFEIRLSRNVSGTNIVKGQFGSILLITTTTTNPRVLYVIKQIKRKSRILVDLDDVNMEIENAQYINQCIGEEDDVTSFFMKNIIFVHGAYVFFISKYLEGYETLFSYLIKIRTPTYTEEICTLIGHLLRCVRLIYEEMDRCGFVHEDLHLENIKILAHPEEGVRKSLVKVLDYGVCSIRGRRQRKESSGLTNTNRVSLGLKNIKANKGRMTPSSSTINLLHPPKGGEPRLTRYSNMTAQNLQNSLHLYYKIVTEDIFTSKISESMRILLASIIIVLSSRENIVREDLIHELSTKKRFMNCDDIYTMFRDHLERSGCAVLSNKNRTNFMNRNSLAKCVSFTKTSEVGAGASRSDSVYEGYLEDKLQKKIRRVQERIHNPQLARNQRVLQTIQYERVNLGAPPLRGMEKLIVGDVKGSVLELRADALGDPPWLSPLGGMEPAD